MEIREIRIGNRIEYLTVQNPDRWEEIVVSPVTFGRLSMEPLRFRPIELTPEWLERAKFEKVGNNKYAFYYQGVVLFGYWLLDGTVNIGHFIPANIKYVNQIQNLFYALTGEELAIDKQISNGN